jgi:hypothetical protein
MNRQFVAALIISTLLVPWPILAGAADPNPTMTEADRHGTPPTQADAEAASLAFLKRTLRDPESARIEWGAITPNNFQRTAFSRKVYGHGLAAEVNAKNAFGGYTGARPYLFFFRDGVLVYAATFDRDGFEQPLIDYRPKR